MFLLCKEELLIENITYKVEIWIENTTYKDKYVVVIDDVVQGAAMD